VVDISKKENTCLLVLQLPGRRRGRYGRLAETGELQQRFGRYGGVPDHHWPIIVVREHGEDDSACVCSLYCLTCLLARWLDSRATRCRTDQDYPDSDSKQAAGDPTG
jgi:hypothetical protein